MESGDDLTRPQAGPAYVVDHLQAMTIGSDRTIIVAVTTMPEMSSTHPAVLAFVVIPLGLFVALLWGTHTASRRLNEDDSTRRRVMLITGTFAAFWMTATWRVAETGVLRLWFATPPPFALLVVAILVVTGALACTGYGRRLARGLPLWMLVGIQGFRLPLEIAMHALYERGVMPEQMS